MVAVIFLAAFAAISSTLVSSAAIGDRAPPTAPDWFNGWEPAATQDSSPAAWSQEPAITLSIGKAGELSSPSSDAPTQTFTFTVSRASVNITVCNASYTQKVHPPVWKTYLFNWADGEPRTTGDIYQPRTLPGPMHLAKHYSTSHLRLWVGAPPTARGFEVTRTYPGPPHILTETADTGITTDFSVNLQPATQTQVSGLFGTSHVDGPKKTPSAAAFCMTCGPWDKALTTECDQHSYTCAISGKLHNYIGIQWESCSSICQCVVEPLGEEACYSDKYVNPIS